MLEGMLVVAPPAGEEDWELGATICCSRAATWAWNSLEAELEFGSRDI